MIFQLTAKNCQVPEASKEYINRNLSKLEQFLPDVAGDLLVLRLVIRKNVDRYHPPRTHLQQHKTYADTKPSLAYFEGSITFRIDKNRLYVHFKGQTLDECIKRGFELIFKELKKFKNLHFSSESEYPDHNSIRGKYA